MEMEKVKVVKKGSKEYDEARVKYLLLFKKDQPEETILGGNLGIKSTQAQALPMPWGCKHLEVRIWDESKPVVFGFFCDIIGCICEPCRTDMGEEYPDACPDEDLYGEFCFDEDEEDEEDWDEIDAWPPEDEDTWFS